MQTSYANMRYSYVAKYASKAEQNAPAFPSLLLEVTNHMDAGGTAQAACQRMLNKMLSEWAYSAQETAHLLLGIPLVRTSVVFQTLNLSAEGSLQQLQEQTNHVNIDMPEDERSVTMDSWLQR